MDSLRRRPQENLSNYDVGGSVRQSSNWPPEHNDPGSEGLLAAVTNVDKDIEVQAIYTTIACEWWKRGTPACMPRKRLHEASLIRRPGFPRDRVTRHLRPFYYTLSHASMQLIALARVVDPNWARYTSQITPSKFLVCVCRSGGDAELQPMVTRVSRGKSLDILPCTIQGVGNFLSFTLLVRWRLIDAANCSRCGNTTIFMRRCACRVFHWISSIDFRSGLWPRCSARTFGLYMHVA